MEKEEDREGSQHLRLATGQEGLPMWPGGEVDGEMGAAPVAGSSGNGERWELRSGGLAAGERTRGSHSH